MFSLLFDTVFPALGQWLGFLSGLAAMPFRDFVEFFLTFHGSGAPIDDITYTFINVFNGSTFEVYAPLDLLWNTMIVDLAYPFRVLVVGIFNLTTLAANALMYMFVEFLTAVSPSMPTWVAFLCLSPVLAIAVGFVRFWVQALPIV